MNIIDSVDKENLDYLLSNILNYKEEKLNLLNNISLRNKEIILYGAGNLGTEAVGILKNLKINPKYIIDSSKDKCGGLIRNVNIISPMSVSNIDKKNCIIAVCVVSFPYSKIKESLKKNGFENIILFWDLLKYLDERNIYSNGWKFENLNENVKKNIIYIYQGFSDNISKALYIQNLYWRIKREEILFSGIKITMVDKFFPKDIIPKFTNHEEFIDCGAYIGNTIEKFLMYTDYKFNKIIAFEPDNKNYNKLKKYVTELPLNIKEKINIYDYAIDENRNKRYFINGLGMNSKFTNDFSTEIKETISLDDLLINERVTVLKIHTEGSEFNIIKGSMNIIKKERPILIITIYHNEEGITKLPLYLMNNLSNYKFYNRVHAYCGIESVLYVIPKERM